MNLWQHSDGEAAWAGRLQIRRNLRSTRKLRLAIIQLSDIHIKSSSDLVLQRTAQIVTATNNCAINADAYLLAVTGDVANAGLKSQYDLALDFFNSITEELKKSGKPVFRFVIPGNHDLDFTSAPDTRDVLLSYVRKNIAKVDSSGETVKQVVSVQGQFFDFEAELLGRTIRPVNNRLAYTLEFNVQDKKIRVKCLNTAWLSTNPEIPAQLVFPCHLIPSEEDNASIEITAFHHPTNWLSPENARSFRIAIERSSDLMMTGHEHETSFYAKQSVTTGSTEHVEGAVLQEHDSDRSAFNVIIVDEIDGTLRTHVCTWTGDRYDAKNGGQFPLTRNRLVRRNEFRNTASYSHFLTDPGLPILHPRKHEIQIADLFIYPGLACKDPYHKFEIQRVVASNQVLEYVRTTPRLMIVGNEVCGKTCLAKTLYRDLQEDNTSIPLLVLGRDIEGTKENDLRRLVRNAVETQYGADSVQAFESLDASQRVFIIDDWHELRYAAKGKAKILDFFKAYAGKLILLSSRLYA